MDPRWLQSRATVENYGHVMLYLYLEFICILFRKNKNQTIKDCILLNIKRITKKKNNKLLEFFISPMEFR